MITINEINDLEKFFANIELPITPVKINAAETITDHDLFVTSHLSVLKNNTDNKSFLSYKDRIYAYKHAILQTLSK